MMKNQHRSKQDVDKLVSDNMALLISIAKNFNPRNHTELENYISAGSLGIVRAALSFDSSKSCFSTHATYCIRNAILNFIKYEKKHSNCTKLEDFSYEPKISRIEENIPSNLTVEEHKIVQMKRDGYSNKEISDKLDISKHKLKVKIKKILTKFRES